MTLKNNIKKKYTQRGKESNKQHARYNNVTKILIIGG